MIVDKNGKLYSKANDEVIAGILLNADVDVKIILKNFPFAEDILTCLNKKQAFGLSNGEESWIVFNVQALAVYDYSYGHFNICKCKNYKQLLNYLRMSLVSHREFRTSEMCVRFLKDKNIIDETV